MMGPTTAEAIEILYHAREIMGHSLETSKIDACMLRALGKPPSECALADLEAVILRNADRGSRATYCRRLRSTFELLNRVGAIDNKVHLNLPRLVEPKRHPRPFSNEQVDRLMAELPEPCLSVAKFALLTGARAMEVCALEGQHLMEGPRGFELLLLGKGGTRLRVPAHPDVVELINSRKTLGRIFPFTSPVQVSSKMGRAIHKVLGPGYTFHQFRHTFGTNIYRVSGNSLILTQQLMRHASISSTLIYAAIADEAPRAAVELLTA